MNNQTMLRFVSDSIRECEKYGITCHLIDEEEISFDDGTTLSGYFSAFEKELVVAIKDPLIIWFQSFIHEYCHFEQWRDNIDLWKQCDITPKDDALGLVFRHFNGELAMTPRTVKKYLNLTAQLEKDCEKRVLNKIKKYKFPLDYAWYAKSANAYITVYYLLDKFRSWFKTPPCLIEEIVEKMPSYINNVIDYQGLANQNFNLYGENCF